MYRLRGTIDGREAVIELDEGRYSVGSSRSSDIHIPMTGVSRHHARLQVSRGSLRIEDLGSTNGTSINGVRVHEGEVPVGAELRVGPVRLRVEAAVPDEPRLAIVIENEPLARASSSTLSISQPDQTTMMLDEHDPIVAARWLACIEAFLARIGAGRGDDLGAALATLGASLSVTGARLVQWSEHGEPLVLGSFGAQHESLTHDEALRLAGAADGHGAGSFDGAPPLAVALSARAGRGLLGLMVWGDFPRQRSSGRLLEMLLRVIEHGRRSPLGDEPRPPARVAAYPELVFPAGYRPCTSPAMVAVYTQMRTLLHGDVPVLLSGETGAGKQALARILHASSDRGHRPLQAIDCAAVAPALLEIELFGAAPGAGMDGRPGKFHLAEGGTLFLDQLDALPPALQAKLSRALQLRAIQPVGGQPQPIDVRVIAAAHVDLTQQMEEGLLRSDLYYRLAGCVIEVPPLRACAGDIPGLVEHFLIRFAGEAGVHLRGLTTGAMRVLTAYGWPGNVRELERVIRRVAYLSADGEIVDVRRLPRWLHEPRSAADTMARLMTELTSLELSPFLAGIEARLIREALHRAGGNKADASRLLGLSHGDLDQKMKQFHIEGKAS
jgi:transcriptional regulator with AAA-type ATPase domain